MKTEINVNHPGETRSRALNPSAFALLELLVVIAILIILAGLILSSVTRGKTAAQRVACINSLKQWGLAAHLYAQDNDDQLAREAAVDGINTWEMTGSSNQSRCLV